MIVGLPDTWSGYAAVLIPACLGSLRRGILRGETFFQALMQ